MQVAQGQVLVRDVLLCKLQLVLHPAPTSAQDGLDLLQLVLVVFIVYHLAYILICTLDL